MDTVQEVLAALIPESLDSIIRANRDKAQLYLSTSEELAALQRSIETLPVKATVSSWAFITLYVVEARDSFVYLVGFNQNERCTWMTSAVSAIDGRRVKTLRGSVYEIEGEGTSDVDTVHICATLHHWKLGSYLGVPHFFF